MYKKQVRLFKWGYMVNDNRKGDWKWKTDLIDTT